MYVSGHIHTDMNKARTLPNDAVVTEGTKSYIFVLDAAAAEKENNETGHETNHPEEHGEAGHKTEAGENTMAFRMVEVITGKTDGSYTEIRLPEPLPENAKVVLNGAYYLFADMKKEETEHEH
jgi:cobalt-zinc-cadmium efflux system membrane fusion protein